MTSQVTLPDSWNLSVILRSETIGFATKQFEFKTDSLVPRSRRVALLLDLT